MPLLALTIFLSAFLLFQVEPLIARYVLPWFGGGPAVWTTCLLFFQVVLLLGYAYAHALTRLRSPRRQGLVHVAVLIASLVFLPIGVAAAWKPTGSGHAVGQILVMLGASVGVPYFVLSATGPLLQSWCTRLMPERAVYRLYGLSNAGSLLALLSYPFVFEPHLTRLAQVQTWSWAYGVFAIGCAATAAALWRATSSTHSATAATRGAGPTPYPETPGTPSDKSQIPNPKSQISSSPAPGSATSPGHPGSPGPTAAPRGASPAPYPGTPGTPSDKSQIPNPKSQILPAPRLLDFAIWAALTALGSVMLLATTNQMCQDVAVVPFLWVLPLSLYLLTFMICFDRPAWYSRGWWALLLMLGAAAALVSVQRGVGAVAIPWQIAAFSLALLAACMVCHGELVLRRPHPRYLTHFYLAIAAGGALGGVLVAVVAPLVFTEFWEFPLGLAACCALAAVAAPRDHRWLLHRWRPALAHGVTTACLLVLALFTLRDVAIDSGRKGTRLAAARNFYGVLRVYQVEHDGNPYIEMHQGRIVHGDQFIDSARHGWPTMYYGPQSGVGLALTRFARQCTPPGPRYSPAPPGTTGTPGTAPAPAPGTGRAVQPLRVGVIGMGAGTTAAYAQPGDVFRFYEINPRVVELADHWFTFMQDARTRGADVEVVMGDARVMMERELAAGQPQRFDVLIADAFTGDAIPIHLLTRQAGALYFRELKPDGILALHISNHFLDLRPVAAGLAAAFGKEAMLIDDPGDGPGRGTAPSTWVLIVDKNAFPHLPGLPVNAVPILWTDDFSSLWQVLGRR